MTFLSFLGVTEILCSFRLLSLGKSGKEIPESSRLEFLEKFLAVLIYQMREKKIPQLLNRRDIADLPLCQTLLGIPKTTWEPRLWEVIDTVVLLAYVSFPASRTLLQ